jgi:hypothetical protein
MTEPTNHAPNSTDTSTDSELLALCAEAREIDANAARLIRSAWRGINSGAHLNDVAFSALNQLHEVGPDYRHTVGLIAAMHAEKNATLRKQLKAIDSFASYVEELQKLTSAEWQDTGVA